MARIRNIKPDFWTDEKLVELEPWERLLFIGIWNFVDDEGFMPYSPKRIKMQVFPGDSLEVSRGVQSLISIGAITLYDSEAGKILKVTNWSKHQKVSNPSPSKYRSLELSVDTTEPLESAEPAPEPVANSPKSTEPSREVHTEGEREGGRNKDLSRSLDEFDRWYSRYPKKEAKGNARKAFIKARQSVSLDVLMAGVDQYAASIKGKDRQFIALPATWLNAERWTDEPPIPPALSPWSKEYHKPIYQEDDDA
jgi:hypothetical protein